MIISNADGKTHAAAIEALLDGAEQVVIAVAFLKKAGADYLGTHINVSFDEGYGVTRAWRAPLPV